MSYDIPNPYRWNETFETLYKIIDDEHKTLFDGIYGCQLKPDDATALKYLRDQIDFHFKHEEEFMDKSSYPSKEHKEKHRQFQGKLKGWTLPVSKENIDFAKEWLCGHIINTDFDYKDKLQI